MSHRLTLEICCGLTGSGKTSWLSTRGVALLKDNKKAFKKYGNLGYTYRQVVSNVVFSKEIEDKYGVGKYGDGVSGISYWSNVYDLEKMRGVDIIWDEMSVDLDSTQYQLVPLSFKRWIQQHRKRGIAIRGTVQDLPMLDISVRRILHKVFYARKIFATREIMAGRPDPKYPFGLIWHRELMREYFAKDVGEYKFEMLGGDVYFINKWSVSIFDTTQEIYAGEFPPLRKVERHWYKENGTIGHTITKYI